MIVIYYAFKFNLKCTKTKKMRAVADTHFTTYVILNFTSSESYKNPVPLDC